MKFYGFSRQGIGHQSDNLPCQDFHLIQPHLDGVIAIIADGVGSSKHSEVASKMASETLGNFLKTTLVESLTLKETEDIIRQGFAHTYEAMMTFIHENGHQKKDYDTTLTALFFNKHFVSIGHSGDGGVIGLKPDGFFVPLTEKLMDKDDEGKEYVCPFRDRQSWKFYSYDGTFARILMATDGIYDLFFPHLLSDEAETMYISLIHRFMNGDGLNKVLDKLSLYQEKVVKDFYTSKATLDDMTLVLLIDEKQSIQKQSDAYYANPDWDHLKKKHRLKIQEASKRYFGNDTSNNNAILPNDERDLIVEEIDSRESQPSLDDELLLHKQESDMSEDKSEIVESSHTTSLNNDMNQVNQNNSPSSETSSDRITPFIQRELNLRDEILGRKASRHTSLNVLTKLKDIVFGNILPKKEHLYVDRHHVPLKLEGTHYTIEQGLTVYPLRNDTGNLYVYSSTYQLEQALNEANYLGSELGLFDAVVSIDDVAFDENHACVGFVSLATSYDVSIEDIISNAQPKFGLFSRTILASNLISLLQFLDAKGLSLSNYHPSAFHVSLTSGRVKLTDPTLLKRKDSNAQMVPFIQDSLVFKLSVTIFQLIMLGFHPFSAHSDLAEDHHVTQKSMDARIRDLKSPFFLKLPKLNQPKGSPSVSILSSKLYTYFYDVFVLGIIQKDQANALTSLNDALLECHQDLIQCQKVRHHQYVGETQLCPWCALHKSLAK